MQIYLGADHRGFELKNALADWLSENYNVVDVGPEEYEKTDDYPDYAFKVAEAVAENPEHSLGIVVCGSGVGMAVAANKVSGVRAGLIHEPAVARVAREDDAINVLALAADFISAEQAREVVQAWMTTGFSGEERHQRRIDKITAYEHERG